MDYKLTWKKALLNCGYTIMYLVFFGFALYGIIQVFLGDAIIAHYCSWKVPEREVICDITIPR